MCNLLDMLQLTHLQEIETFHEHEKSRWQSFTQKVCEGEGREVLGEVACGVRGMWCEGERHVV